jgi:hypothetical protein
MNGYDEWRWLEWASAIDVSVNEQSPKGDLIASRFSDT